MYINDYEVYAGSIKISKIVMNNEVLYEANSSGDIIIDVTDYSVVLGSTISVIYELKGNVTEEQISVIYDDTMFTKNGNNFTVIGEGYSEIIYCIDNKPKQTIRVATAWYNDVILDFSQSSEMPEFPSNITYNLKSGSYGFSLTQYAGGGYGLVSGNKNIDSSVSSGYLKLDLSNIVGTFAIRVTYSYQTESINYDYGRLYLTTSSSVPSYTSDTDSFLKVGGSTAVNNAVITSSEKNAGIYYLHFLYRKDSSASTGYDAFCIHKIEILGAGFEYPITYIEFDSDNILCKTGDSININPLILPNNATETITYTYDSQFIEEIGNNILCKKSGNTSLTLSSKYVANKNINLVIEPSYISDIVLESSLNLDETIYEGDSFSITPSTVPLYHDDELICEYDNYYLNKVGNRFEILDTAMGKTLTITYRGLNVYKEYTFAVSDKPGFYVEYTIEPRDSSDKVNSYYTRSSINYYYYLPRIYTDSSTWSVTGYDKIEITKTDGTTTDDVTTLASDVEKIKVWYPKDTTYNIRFQGYSSSYPCYVNSILNDNKMNTSNLTSLSYMFYYCSKLTSLDLSNWDTSNVNNMSYMFYYCSKLTSLDLSNWDTSNVTTRSSMLSSVPTTVDWHYNETNYANWTLTESQTDYSGIFPWNQAYIEYTIEPRNTSDKLSATSFSSDYYYYLPRIYTGSSTFSNPKSSNLLITKKDGAITNSLSTLASDVEKIKVFYNKNNLYKFSFYGSSTSQPCKVKEILNVKECIKTDMSYMFSYCSSLTSLDLSNWNTSNVNNMNRMFFICSSLTSLDVSNWNTSNVTNMDYMFYNCSSLTSLDLSNFDTSKVTSMSYMFAYCSKLTSLDLSNFDTSKVTSMSSMLLSVPGTVDWHYEENNYTNWTLTESQTKYSGLFPWNFNPNYYMEYTVDNTSTVALNGGSSEYKYGIPRIYSSSSSYAYSVMAEITLLDGTITNDLSTTCDMIEKVKLWFPADSYSVKFYGESSYSGCKPKIKNLNYINTDRIKNIDNMFYYCSSLETLDLRQCDFRNLESLANNFITGSTLTNIFIPNNFNENFVISGSDYLSTLKNIIFNENQDVHSFSSIFTTELVSINPSYKLAINITNGINNIYLTNLFERPYELVLEPEIGYEVCYKDDNDLFSIVCEHSGTIISSVYPGIGNGNYSQNKIDYSLYVKFIRKEKFLNANLTSGTIYSEVFAAESGKAKLEISYKDNDTYTLISEKSADEYNNNGIASLTLDFVDILELMENSSTNEIILKFYFNAPSTWTGGSSHYGNSNFYLSKNIMIEY